MTNPANRLTRSLWRPLAAIASGALLASAFPVFPTDSPEAAWVGLVPLFLVAVFSRPRESFGWGFLGGLCFWLLSLSWLLRLIFTGGPLLGVVAGWILLSGYCALYTGAWTTAVSTVWKASKVSGGKDETSHAATDTRHLTPDASSLPFRRTVSLMIVAPLLWVGFEYLRGTVLTGFPWNGLGVSQYRNLGVIQAARWGGVYAVSALVVFVNAGLALTGMRIVLVATGRLPRKLHLELMLGLLVPVVIWQGGFQVARGIAIESGERPSLTVACIQPNIPQVQKWSSRMERRTLEVLRDKTRLAMMPGVDLVLWPETAAPRPFAPGADVVGWVADLVREGGVPLLAGALEIVPGEEGMPERLFNSAFLFDATGQIVTRYRKRHLVPFGEYIPLGRQLPFLQRYAPLGFSCSAGDEQTVFRLRPAQRDCGGQVRCQVSGVMEEGDRSDRTDLSDSPPVPKPETRNLKAVLFSVLICFEDVFPYLARDAVRGGAQLLVNQTNDAWFQGSRAAQQHVGHGVFRCVETGAPAVRCANTGVTCVIDRNGSLRSYGMPGDCLVPQDTEGLLLRPVPLRLDTDPLPFYARHGDLPFALPCGIVCGLLIAWWLLQWVRGRIAPQRRA